MPDDPNRCREHARQCAELARQTVSPEARDHFTALEQSWLRLAAEIESSQKLLDLIDEISRDLVPDVTLVVSSFPQPLMDYKHRARPRAFSR